MRERSPFHITDCVKVGGIEKIVAAVNGGTRGKWRCIENFAPQNTAGSLRSAATSTQTRQEQARELPLRQFRNSMAERWGLPPRNAIEPPSRQEKP